MLPMAFDGMPEPEGAQFSCGSSALCAFHTPPPAAPAKIWQYSSPASFDTAVADLSDRVGRLAPRLAATS